MNPEYIRRLETELETNRRREVIEMHLFDDVAAEEKALCEADTSHDTRRSAMCYLEDRLHGASGRRRLREVQGPGDTVRREGAQDLEAEGLLDEAEEYRQLAETLLRETDE